MSEPTALRVCWCTLVAFLGSACGDSIEPGDQEPGELVTLSPRANSVEADREAPIVITLSRRLAELDTGLVRVFGRWSGVHQGELTVESDGRLLIFTPATPFFAGEQVTITVSGRLAFGTDQSLGTSYSWQFWVVGEQSDDLQLATTTEIRNPGEDWIQTYGAYAGDLNEDGRPDLMLPNELSNDVRIFLAGSGGGLGGFATYPIPSGDRPSTNEGADFDGDGHLDWVVGSSRNNVVTVFIGDGDGGVSRQTNYVADVGVRGVCVLDLNDDGAPDFVTANREGAAGDGNISLFLNLGDGTFEKSSDVNTGAEGETSCATGDADSDGLIDLFIGAIKSDEIVLLGNNGNGTLNELDRAPAGGGPWMLGSGDIDGDGHVDVVGSNVPENNLVVLHGDGNGSIGRRMLLTTGDTPIAVDVGDLDGDGDLDLVSSNFSSGDFQIFRNNGSGGFGAPESLPARTAGSCAIIVDFDSDGDVDLIGIDELDDLVFFFRNGS